ncbi:FSCN2 [Cervus elaphus hippelaphus]|uniref:FSCN2 n=1 Tax=Cervus elaphus hippelaphus TaxID=46360 RepID=A0A212D9A2_CEREH|nr:FSCN2 [Cervus elaphus hippelaphus]
MVTEMVLVVLLVMVMVLVVMEMMTVMVMMMVVVATQALVLPAGEDEEFTLKLINRPILVLRGLDGFVCHRRGSNQLDTNRSVYDVFHLSFSDGAYQIRGRGGGFWHTGSHGSVYSDGERAEDFLFEFRERGRLAIRARSGKYLRGGASGLLRADADAPAGVALWEY